MIWKHLTGYFFPPTRKEMTKLGSRGVARTLAVTIDLSI